MTGTCKTELIGQILDKEFNMFQAVPTLQRAACQDDPDGFRLIRTAQFLTWSEATLKSYLHDLNEALENGRNLMTEKYARMAELIPCKNPDPNIDLIVEEQLEWQKEMADKYPHLMARARPLSSSDDSLHQTSFETYLRRELETYSARTLRSLHDDILEKQREGHNMAEEIHEYMVRALGYDSLAEAEEHCAERTVRPT